MGAGLDGGLLVFTDLDGCLLDEHTYSWERARPALEALRARGVPLLLCSSKTRSEMEALARELGLAWPYVVENGGAFVIPGDHSSAAQDRHPRRPQEPRVVVLGTPMAT